MGTSWPLVTATLDGMGLAEQLPTTGFNEGDERVNPATCDTDGIEDLSDMALATPGGVWEPCCLMTDMGAKAPPAKGVEDAVEPGEDNDERPGRNTENGASPPLMAGYACAAPLEVV